MVDLCAAVFDWAKYKTTKGAVKIHLRLDHDVRFVTRLKTNVSFVVVESRPVAPNTGVLRDEVVVFTQHATEDNDRFFRRLVYWDEEHHRRFEFLTNHLTLDAVLVAVLYRQRGQIELLFRALKQNLKIKTFVGTWSTRSRFKFGQH